MSVGDKLDIDYGRSTVRRVTVVQRQQGEESAGTKSMTGLCLNLSDRAEGNAPTAAVDWVALYATAFAELSDGAVVLDAQGRVLWSNRAAARLLASSPKELSGRRLDEVHRIRWLHFGDEEAARRALRDKGHWRGTTFHLLPNGREIRIDSSVDVLRGEAGAPLGSVVMMREFSEAPPVQGQESEQRLQLAQKVAQMGWFDWSIRTDTSVSSDQAHALHGLRPGTFQGGFKEWKKFVHPDDLADVEQGVKDSLHQGGEHSHLHRVIWPDGSIHWLRTRLRVFADEAGKPVRMVGVMLDVTDLKEAEELARLKSHELERRVAARTAALRESIGQLEAFVYSISHDFRAPLRALDGFAQAVLEDDGERLSPSSLDALERIRRAAQRMDALTADLVDYTRLDRADLGCAPFSLEAAVEEVLLTLDKEIRERRAIVQVERPLPSVVGHAPTVRLVITHLVSNGLKFVAEGVRPEIRISAAEHDADIRLSVQDNGIGIAPEHQERIFRVFERLHGIENYSGTGIGLAVVKKAMQRMGGRVGLESRPGEGSSFWVEWPRPNS